MEHKKFANAAAQNAWATAEKAAAFLGEDAKLVQDLIALAEQRAARVAMTVLDDGTKVPLTSDAAAWTLARRLVEKAEYAEIYDGCAEPGYDDKLVVLANWNGKNARWGAAVEKLERQHGVPFTLEWSDEWVMCNACYKGVRCSPDSYGWTRYYWDDNSDIICGDCVRDAYTDEYIERLTNQPERANTLLDTADLENAGFSLLNVKFEKGFHYGMDADPGRILKTLRAAGISKVIFDINGGASQFYVTFWVWVPSAEVGAAQAALDGAPHDAVNGPSIAGAMEAALKQAARTPDPIGTEPGFVYTKVGMGEDGSPTVEKRWMTNEEFVDGIK